MAIVVGAFKSKQAVSSAVSALRQLDVKDKDLGLIARGESSRVHESIVRVFGFLRQLTDGGRIQMREGIIVTTMINAGIDMIEALSYLKAVRRGYLVLAVRATPATAPWLAEAMRRAGAVTATDSATERELTTLPSSYRRKYYSQKSRIA